MAANLLTQPRFWDKKAVLAKLETTYGTDPTPTGAVNWIEARNVSLTPMDANKVERNIEMPYMGAAGEVITSMWAKLSYDIALAPSGTLGTVPKWGPCLMACGMSETISAGASVEYNLVSENVSSLTMYVNIDGVLHKLLGARGDAKFKIDAEGTPMISYSFDSVYVAPVAGGMPTVTRTGWAIEEGVNSANTTAVTVNGVALALSSLEFGLGNKIERINLPGPQVEVAKTGHAVTGSITVLAPAIGVFDPFALAQAGTTVPMQVTHGSVAGRKAQIDMKLRLGAPEYTQIKRMAGYKLPFTATPVAGHDEFALKLI